MYFDITREILEKRILLVNASVTPLSVQLAHACKCRSPSGAVVRLLRLAQRGFHGFHFWWPPRGGPDPEDRWRIGFLIFQTSASR